MKKTISIIIAICLLTAILVPCLILFSKNETKPPNENEDDPTDPDVDINISIPKDPTDTDNPVLSHPTIGDNSGDTDNNDTDKENTSGSTEAENNNNNESPKVEEDKIENIKDKIPEIVEKLPDNKVVHGTKDESIQQIGPSSGEDRNDAIIKEKEESAPKEDKIEEAILKKEESSTGTAKDDVVVKDDTVDTDGGGKNASDFKISVGGDNPFDDATKTVIDDTPVEEYIEDGEDRPGSGIYF